MDQNDPRRAIFQRRPERTPDDIRLELRRVPTKGTISGVVLSSDLTGCHTHFWHGRTLPCHGGDCPACNDLCPKRWYAYLIAAPPDTWRPYILEITAAATDQIDAYWTSHRTLRGARVSATRIPARANGRVVIDVRQPIDDKIDLPKCPDLEAILIKIWEASWARDSLKIAPTVPRGSEQEHATQVAEATEHKKQYRSVKRGTQPASINDTLSRSIALSNAVTNGQSEGHDG